jgi:hypothetical protein
MIRPVLALLLMLTTSAFAQADGDSPLQKQVEWEKRRLQVRITSYLYEGVAQRPSWRDGITFRHWQVAGEDGDAPLVRATTWAVYEGENRLSVPDYLQRVGRVEESVKLRGRVKRLTLVSNVTFGVGTAGGVTAVGGFAASALSGGDQDRYVMANTALSVGVGALVAGLVTSHVTASRAARLRHDYAQTLSQSEVVGEVVAYDDALRKEIGLISAAP